jgi:autotransporter-associated beta strand protein
MWKSASAKAVGSLIGLLALTSFAPALAINGYVPANYDRFSSGYPSAPINNTNSGFIGLGYNWSGVGWCSADSTQSVALLAPGFFLYANHYSYNLSSGSTLVFCSNNGTLETHTVSSLSGSLGGTNSDLGIGVLSSPVSSNIAAYSILFLGYSTGNYSAKNLLVYGHGGSSPRIGTDTVSDIVYGLYTSDGTTLTYHPGYYMKSLYDSSTTGLAKLESGDSGSPSFFYDSGSHTLYLAGAHFATDFSTVGYDSSLSMMLNYVNAYMAGYGYLPTVYTPPTTTWISSSSNTWGDTANWSGGAIPGDVVAGSKVLTCASVLFDAASASQHTISLDGYRTVTGITFAAASGSNGFTIATGSTGYLTIGEAGIKNKDNDVQTFSCNIVMRSPQIWDAGQGGLLVTGSINTSGNLLLIKGSGNTVLGGLISYSGGLAKDGSGTLILSGTAANTYSGTTFIHNGVLQIGDGGADGSLGTGAVADDAVLAFNRSDTFTVSNLISGAGEVRQIGSGTLIFSGTNTYMGTTTVTGGILKLANSSALGTTAAGTIVHSGGALDLNGLNIGNEPLTVYGTGSSGSGALINTNTSAGAAFNGILTLGANASIGGSGNITLNGALNCGTYALTKIGSSTLSINGSQIWGDNSTITALTGTLSFKQAAGATTAVAANTPILYIASGATVNVDATNNDPFTDDATSTQRVQIVNYSNGSFNLTAGAASVAGIAGAGATTVTGGSILTCDYLFQSQLTIGAGSTVVINPISSSSSSLDLFFADSVPLSGGEISLVPEPATWILITIGVLCLLCRCKRK